jgi:hypothetical protein
VNDPCSIDPLDVTAHDTAGGTAGAAYAPGTLVAGRYRLVRKLGEGGMAEVWLAVHEALKKEVAVKFATAPEPYGLVPETLARFRFEAQVSAQLGERTRHVVCVHDAGEHDAGPRGAVPFLVMDYVRGPTLAHLLAVEGPMAAERFAGVLDQVADALGAAHAMGIVHRDLKPSNLMLADEPGGSTTVKLADFGIAKAVRKDLALDRPKETAFGLRMGSPAYMSPEQVTGSGEVGVQTDLWALGVVAYEALTGQDCFRASSMPQLYSGICTARFEPASSVRADLPRALDAWFARAITVEPSDRFPSADEMARSFRLALGRPTARRAPWFAIAAVVFGIAVAAMGIRAYEARSGAAVAAPSETALPPATPVATGPVVAPAAEAAPSSPVAVPAPAEPQLPRNPGPSLAHTPPRAHAPPAPSSPPPATPMSPPPAPEKVTEPGDHP